MLNIVSIGTFINNIPIEYLINIFISIRYTRDNNDLECYTIEFLINNIQIDKINPRSLLLQTVRIE